jgi:hypothetical protein
MGGSSTVPYVSDTNGGPPGIYGTLGIYASGNIPGGRYSVSSWTDNSGNFWLFGGYGSDSSGNVVILNDIWEYQSSASQSQTTTPTFLPVAGTYTTTQTVTISDTTPNATIYYTTNGNLPTTSSAKYTGAITVSATETLEAIAVATGYSASAVQSASYTINLPQAAKPTFSVPAGSYNSAQSVTISDTTPNATIYFTTDGSTPTTSSTKYTGAISVSATETLMAIATATGYTTSAVQSASYTINLTQVAAPTFSVPAGSYNSAQSVTISDTNPGSTIYYTTNGTVPTTSSTKYTGAISVSATETLMAIATATGYTTSAVQSATYTITLIQTATPAFSVSAGTYTAAQTVTISDITPSATIYFTTDGTTPTIASSVYSAPITVSSTETLEAIATAAGYTTSAVQSATYTINLPVPSFTISGTAVTLSAGITTGNTSTITVTPSNGFTGNVALTAAVTSSPSGVLYPPTLSFGTTSPVSITGTTAGTATLTIATTAATKAALVQPKHPGLPWYAAGGATLACLLLFGIPARRRSWRTLLGALVLLMFLSGGVFACGGGGSAGGGGGGGGGGTSGTTAGTYTITVTGTSGSTTATNTVTLTVQ